MSIEVGGKAPDFELRGTGGPEPVRLSGYRGDRNVVLLFFPFAFSGVCTAEMCHVRNALDDYTALDAEVLGITADSPFALKVWVAQNDPGFVVLSDFNREVAPRYDSLYEKFQVFQGVPKRSVFLVDKQGIIRYFEICGSPAEQPDFSALLAALGRLT